MRLTALITSFTGTFLAGLGRVSCLEGSGTWDSEGSRDRKGPWAS